jgi:hypothetical protein
MIKLYNESGKLVFEKQFHILKRNFKILCFFSSFLSGDNFRCFIDDTWWPGTIVKREAYDPRHENSPFQCYIIRWDNGENEERLSPWDIFECDDSRMIDFILFF